MAAAAALHIIMGTHSGDTRVPSRVAVMRSSSDCSPPIPVATLTPTRLGSTVGWPDPLRASSTATMANWVNRSMRRCSRRGIQVSGSQSLT